MTHPTPNNRSLIVLAVMLVAILEVLDSTIVTVSLPQMMGQLGANSEQITWVLTSYVVASAILMPLTGFLVNRLGQKSLLLIDIVGFMASSALCGLSTDLTAMIVFRIMQGAFGAALIPISQAVLRDTFPLEQQGKAMAIWGIGIMAAPVLGPTLGGYITESFSWRWIFYINIPVCVISFLLTSAVIKQTPKKFAPIDWFGLALMAVGIGAMQLVLDQGNDKNWFNSNLILSMTIASVFCLAYFIIRGWNKPDNVIKLKLFKDRNLTIATLMLGIFAAAMFSIIAVQPLMLQTLYNYPVITSGLVMAPRGFAAAISMAIVPTIMKRYGSRVSVIAGILLTSYGTYLMSHYNLNISMWQVIFPTAIQGLGMGLFFVPLSVTALSTMSKEDNSEGSGLFSYGRMLGTSIGISVLSTIITRETQINWNRLGGHISQFNPGLFNWLNAQHLNLHDPTTTAQLANLLGRQASMIAYLDGYWLLALAFLTLLPLALLLKPCKDMQV